MSQVEWVSTEEVPLVHQYREFSCILQHRSVLDTILLHLLKLIELTQRQKYQTRPDRQKPQLLKTTIL